MPNNVVKPFILPYRHQYCLSMEFTIRLLCSFMSLIRCILPINHSQANRLYYHIRTQFSVWGIHFQYRQLNYMLGHVHDSHTAFAYMKSFCMMESACLLQAGEEKGEGMGGK